MILFDSLNEEIEVESVGVDQLPKLNPPQPDRGHKKIKKDPHVKTKRPKTIPILTPSNLKRTTKASKDGITIKLNSSDWILTQITAISSCKVKHGQYITPDTIKFINGNHNAWSNEHTKKYYQTFVGGHNYLNHIQEPSKSFGFIPDARLRKISIGNNNDDDFVYYIDLLVATSTTASPNYNIVKGIDSGDINKLSMGCQSPSIKCTKCGNVSEDESQDCVHITNSLGKKFYTPDGDISQIAMLVWDKDRDGNQGIIDWFEISYLTEVPAFSGAVTGWKIDLPKNTDVFFNLPESAMQRSKEPIKDGIGCWLRKGKIKEV